MRRFPRRFFMFVTPGWVCGWCGTVRCGWSRGRRARAGAGSADGSGCRRRASARGRRPGRAATCSSGWRRLVSPGVVSAAAGELSKPVTATSGPARRPRSLRARSDAEGEGVGRADDRGGRVGRVEQPVGGGPAGVEVVGLLGVQVGLEAEVGERRRASPGAGRGRSRSRGASRGARSGGGPAPATCWVAARMPERPSTSTQARSSSPSHERPNVANGTPSSRRAATRPSSVWVLASTNASTAVVARSSRYAAISSASSSAWHRMRWQPAAPADSASACRNWSSSRAARSSRERLHLDPDQPRALVAQRAGGPVGAVAELVDRGQDPVAGGRARPGPGCSARWRPTGRETPTCRATSPRVTCPCGVGTALAARTRCLALKSRTVTEVTQHISPRQPPGCSRCCTTSSSCVAAPGPAARGRRRAGPPRRRERLVRRRRPPPRHARARRRRLGPRPGPVGHDRRRPSGVLLRRARPRRPAARPDRAARPVPRARRATPSTRRSWSSRSPRSPSTSCCRLTAGTDLQPMAAVKRGDAGPRVRAAAGTPGGLRWADGDLEVG